MIYHIIGTISSKLEESLIIDNQGMGYHVFVPTTTINELTTNPPEDKVKLYTYHHIREDTQALYGFLSEADRQFFITITSVSGVGPKVGLKILSTLPLNQFVNAIMQDDLASLTTVSGVGKKMAERLVLELKDKLPKIYAATDLGSSIQAATPLPKHDDELFLALKTLGYNSDEIKRAFIRSAKSLKEDQTLETSIKILLKNL